MLHVYRDDITTSVTLSDTITVGDSTVLKNKLIAPMGFMVYFQPVE
jgi:hypothetical protein